MTKRVLITDDCDSHLIAGLTQRGYSCDFRPTITAAETFDLIGGYMGLIINSKITVDKAFLDRAVLLKFIGRLGSGMEIVDRKYAAECGVLVLSSPEGNRNAVGEQALGMLLSLSNHLCRADREVRSGVWHREKNRGWELGGKTIGIIGFGHTGSSFASKLSGLGMRVLSYDKYLGSGYAHVMPWIEEVKSIDQIQREADIVSLHLPFTSETRWMVDASFIRACKPGWVLINTSRGACVKTNDLVEGLKMGILKGACLDVFENEKVESFTQEEELLYGELYEMDQVVLSPHIAGWTVESKRRMADILLEKIDTLFINN
jgi:D-3-phosphoglycerate dehydrogenase